MVVFKFIPSCDRLINFNLELWVLNRFQTSKDLCSLRMMEGHDKVSEWFTRLNHLSLKLDHGHQVFKRLAEYRPGSFLSRGFGRAQSLNGVLKQGLTVLRDAGYTRVRVRPHQVTHQLNEMSFVLF